MKLGDSLGNQLGLKDWLWLVLLISCLLGIAVTFAEPALGALQLIGVLVQVQRAPCAATHNISITVIRYLFIMLGPWSLFLVLAVSAGVGIATVLGVLRNLHNFKLRWLIFATLTPTLILSIIIEVKIFNIFLVNTQYACPEIKEVIGLAWDCGAVTTGPVTVPIVYHHVLTFFHLQQGVVSWNWCFSSSKKEKRT